VRLHHHLLVRGQATVNSSVRRLAVAFVVAVAVLHDQRLERGHLVDSGQSKTSPA